MADPRRFKIQRPTPAGRARAQQPEIIARKTSILTASVQEVKLEPHFRVNVLFLTQADSPYAIKDTDDFITVTNNGAVMKLLLPTTIGRSGQRLSVGKFGGAFDVEVRAASGDQVGAAGFTGARIAAADSANMLLIANERNRVWWIEAVRGTVTEF